MEEVDDDDETLGTYPHNVAPLNRSHILELSDGSDDEDGCPASALRFGLKTAKKPRLRPVYKHPGDTKNRTGPL